MMSNNNSQRIEWLDILKCIAMYLVVIGHAKRSPITPETYRYIIYSFHMPLFFAVSGMAYYLQMKKRDYNFTDLLKNKAKTLLWPYFILNILALPLWTLNFKVLSYHEKSYAELMLGLFYSHEEKFDLPANPMWFVVALFFVTILFYLIEKWSKNNEQMLVLMVLAVASFGYSMSFRKGEFWAPWHLDTVPMAVAMFLSGCLFIKHLDFIKGLLGSGKRQLLWVVVLFPCAYCCARFNNKVSVSGNVYGSIVLLAGAFIGFSAICIIVAMNLPRWRIFFFIGRNTLVYLAFHAGMLRTLLEYSDETNAFITLHPILAGTLVFILLIPAAWVVERWLPFLIGRPYHKYKKTA